MKRIAIIDLGSNSIRFIIIEVESNGAYKLIYQEKKSIRLAEGMSPSSRLLSEEAQMRALRCLAVYAGIIKVQQVDKVLAGASRTKCSERSLFPSKSPPVHRHSHDNHQRPERSISGGFRGSPYNRCQRFPAF